MRTASHGAVSATCEAVGYYVDVYGDSFTLALDWNGKTWARQTTPDPDGKKATGEALSVLSGVSCVSATLCEASGEYIDNSTGVALNFGAQWSGGKWTQKAMPTPSNSFVSYIQSVSCTSTKICVAVGENLYYTSSTTNVVVPEAETWNGHAWQLMTV